MATFKMRAKPRKPIKRTIHIERDISDFCNAKDLTEFIEKIVNKGIPLDQISIDIYYEDYYFKWQEKESDENYNKRLDVYKEKLKEWNEWYKENEVSILQIEEDKKQKAIRADAVRIAKLQEQIEKIKDKYNA